MPVRVERALRRAANALAKKGELRLSKKYDTLEEAKNAFVYGRMRKLGYKVGRGKK
jgi:hypothetical protein